MADNQIELRTITELLGLNFYIPDYQRGYRWTHQNVTQLLEDIWEYRQEKSNANTFYCLQPIVVRKKSWKDASGKGVEGYELIDGQQRLTTIHRILHYLSKEHLRMDSLKEEYGKEVYTLDYKTRPETKAFLNTNTYNDSKPDLYYLSEAYQTIKSWFENEENMIGRSGKNTFLDTLLPDVQLPKSKENWPEWSIQVIWYEIQDNTQKSKELFTRLNRGKIPLTSAELIKAKFVNQDSFKELDQDDRIKRRTQLVQIWDEIENQLNNPKFWAFISNAPLEYYSSKIEYLFDVATGKKSNESDKLYSFLHFFDKKEDADSLWEKWIKVEEIYRSLRYWYTDKNLYHKIGFLIATGTSIRDLVAIKKNWTKDRFEHEINQLIANAIPDNWSDLDYQNRNDTEKITNTLLLTNVELTRLNENINDFFPFEIYKRISKSLEHIHAQNIEGINVNKQEQWKTWLTTHLDVLPSVVNDPVKVEEITEAVNNALDDLKYTQFEELSTRILNLLPKEEGEEGDYLHKIQNLALLGIEENIMLSNSVFEVKRRKIIELDKKGAFLPLATRRIFLNYYAEESSPNYSLWTSQERKNYLREIEECLAPYLNLKLKNDED
ncbi:DUF262 domain-containing protein [Lewinella sp. LCG006]|uniref:DUF262 domain-containing protein n=1 Tax=Lewinella sp. LCG006 TaxID=3231911 RepID=UPI0034601DCA